VVLQVVVKFSVEPLIRGYAQRTASPGLGTDQAIFGGFTSVMWIILAYGVTFKKGSAILGSALMGLINSFIGLDPLAGFPLFLIYLVTGLCVELGLFLRPRSVKFSASGAVGNVAFFAMFVCFAGFYKGKWLLASFIPIALAASFVSGMVGGLVALGLLKSLERAGLLATERARVLTSIP